MLKTHPRRHVSGILYNGGVNEVLVLLVHELDNATFCCSR